MADKKTNKKPNNEDAQYIPERRAIQILDILKEISDETHPVKQSEILQAMKDTGDATTENAGTLSKSIDEILLQINPLEYSAEPDNDNEYRIKYKGYKENLVSKKQDIKDGIIEAKKAPSITDLFYVHELSNTDLDKIIQAVCFSNTLDSDSKAELIKKLVNISSGYYRTPYYSKERKELTFNPKGIYNRLQGKGADENKLLGENIAKIQTAINEGIRISFIFNEYDETGHFKERYSHIISPYYIVVYHDMYYLIGGKEGKKSAAHFRIDLMTKVNFATDEKGENIKIEAMSHFKNLPVRNQWNPEKYMSEHLYMAYDEPCRIHIKIPNDMYTVIHDWFGMYYRKCNTECEKGEKGYDIVEVISSPDMIVHWAMQYAGAVEIMDEDIRKKIRIELSDASKKYR